MTAKSDQTDAYRMTAEEVVGGLGSDPQRGATRPNRLTYAEIARVTDGARTRTLRSHNPPNPVSTADCDDIDPYARHLAHASLLPCPDLRLRGAG